MRTETTVSTSTSYFCETCNSKHWVAICIYKCSVCGKEICNDCSQKITMLDGTLSFQDDYDPSFGLYLENEGDFPVCKDCYDKAQKTVKFYNKDLNKMIKQFNKDLQKLNKQLLKDIKNV